MDINATHDLPCSVQFTKEQLTEIFRLQGEANDVMSDAWRNSSNREIPYYRASWIEFAEALMHIGFKWWKKEHKDQASFDNAVEQSIMEIVDVMHFAASDYIRSDRGFPTHAKYPYLVSMDSSGELEYCEMWNSVSIHEVIEQAVADIILRKSVRWCWINMLAECFKVDETKLYGMYIGKNVLNKFRTTHGQREGTYAKIWDGVEDNVYLTDFIETATRDGIGFTASSLDLYLTELYTRYTQDNATRIA